MTAGYIYLGIGVFGFLISFIADKEKTKMAAMGFVRILLTVLPIILFIFILMGLVQVFLPQDTVANILGKSNSLVSVLAGEVLGSISLIQPGAVFPFAGYLKDSGANWGAIYGFVMSAILIGVSTLPLEIKMLGKRFTIVRNTLTFGIIFCFGFIIQGGIS